MSEASMYLRNLNESLYQRIAELEQRIGELTAERDEARHRNAQVELEAVEYSNRMHDAIARAEAAEARVVALNIECGELQGQLEAAELALTAERQRIMDMEDDRDSWRYISEISNEAFAEMEAWAKLWADTAEKTSTLLAAERQRREECEAALRAFKYPGLYPNKFEQAANAYFSRYPSESSPKVAG